MINNPDIGAIAYTRLLGIPKRAENTFCALKAKNTMGVEFVNDVDKEAFREATSGMINDYCTQYPGVKKLLDIIDSVE